MDWDFFTVYSGHISDRAVLRLTHSPPSTYCRASGPPSKSLNPQTTHEILPIMKMYRPISISEGWIGGCVVGAFSRYAFHATSFNLHKSQMSYGTQRKQQYPTVLEKGKKGDKRNIRNRWRM
jgi:hypothetical protein